MLKRLLALFSVCALVITAYAVPALAAKGSSHTPYDWYKSGAPYTLQGPEDLLEFADLVNGKADATKAGRSHDDFKNQTVSLGDKISLSGSSMDPIGGQKIAGSNSYYCFDGTFDGNGNAIYNFKVKTPDTYENIGIFGLTGPNSTIENLTLRKGATVSVKASGSQLIKNVGVLAGCSYGRIVSCTIESSATFSVESSTNATLQNPIVIQNVGGLVGHAYKDVVNCETTVKFKVSSTGSGSSSNNGCTVVNIGGVIGCAGTQATGIPEVDYINAGGPLSGSIVGCEHIASLEVDVSGDNAHSVAVGGIAGYSRSDFDGCLNSSPVQTKQGVDVGGIVGSFRASLFESSSSDDGASAGAIKIFNCKNGDSIKDTEAFNANVFGYANVGGICGRAGSNTVILGCTNGDTARTPPQNFVLALREGESYAGGIVGATSGEVSFCGNYGSVYAGRFIDSSGPKVTSNITKQRGYVAGIAGYLHKPSSSTVTPAIYSNINYGNINALDVEDGASSSYQQNIVAVNHGVAYDNFALPGLCYNNSLMYENYAGTNLIVSEKDLCENELVKNVELGSAMGASKRDYYVDPEITNLFTLLEVIDGNAPLNDYAVNWVRPYGESALPILSTRLDPNNKKDISPSSYNWEQVKAAPYLGGAVGSPYFRVKNGVKTYYQNVDFKLTPDPNGKEPSTGKPYTASIQGAGNFIGSKTEPYDVGALDLGSCLVKIENQQYNTSPHSASSLQATVTTTSGIEVDPQLYELKWGTQSSAWAFSASVGGDPVNAGTYDVIVEPKEGRSNIEGSLRGYCVIEKANIGRVGVDSGWSARLNQNGSSLTWTSALTGAAPTITLPYTGHPIMPNFSITFKGKELPKYLDTSEYASYTGQGFQVSAGAGDPSLLNISPAVYSNGQIVASENIGSKSAVTKGGVKIASYWGDRSASSNFIGSDVLEFNIDPTLKVDLSVLQDLADQNSPNLGMGTVYTEYKANGNKVVYEEGYINSLPANKGYEPDIYVSYLGSHLVRDVDYKVTYSNNRSVGTASYTILPLNEKHFTGSFTGHFEIVQGNPYEFTFGQFKNETCTITGFKYLGGRKSFNLKSNDIPIPSTYTSDGSYGEAVKYDNPNGLETDGSSSVAGRTYTVSAIGDYAFAQMGLNLGGSSLSDTAKIKEIEIPSSIQTIGRYAFSADSANNAAYTKITFASGSKLTTVREGAFQNQSKLTSFAFPASVTEIDKNVFDKGGAAASVMQLDTLTYAGKASGSLAVTLPYNARAKGNYNFAGWVCKNDGKLYAPGSSYTVSTKEANFTARWLAQTSVSWPSGAVEKRGFTQIILKKATAKVHNMSNTSAVQIQYALTTTNKAPDVNDKAWQTSTTFNNLQVDTTYYAFAKVVPTTTYDVSISSGVAVRTDKSPSISSADYSGAFMISMTQPTLSATSFTYNGKVQKPTVKYVLIDGKPLDPGYDYTVSYSNANSTKAGTYKVIITGVGEFTGKKELTYKIAPQNAKKAAVTLKATNKVYTGKAVKCSIKSVKLSGKTLKLNTDYTVSYKNNKKLGKATVTIKFKGNYTGTISKTFKIVPKAPTGIKVAAGASSFTVKWKAVSKTHSSGYQIRYAVSKSKLAKAKPISIKKRTTTAMTIGKLKAKKVYYVQMRTYKKVGKTTHYGVWTTAKKIKTL